MPTNSPSAFVLPTKTRNKFSTYPSSPSSIPLSGKDNQSLQHPQKPNVCRKTEERQKIKKIMTNDHIPSARSRPTARVLFFCLSEGTVCSLFPRGTPGKGNHEHGLCIAQRKKIEDPEEQGKNLQIFLNILYMGFLRYPSHKVFSHFTRAQIRPSVVHLCWWGHFYFILLFHLPPGSDNLVSSTHSPSRPLIQIYPLCPHNFRHPSIFGAGRREGALCSLSLSLAHSAITLCTTPNAPHSNHLPSRIT